MTSAQPVSLPKKISDKLKLRGILQNNLSALFKNVSVMKYKERPRNCSSLKEAKETTGLPRWLSGKGSARQCRRHRFDPWVGKIPWSRKWLPTPVFLPRKSHGLRSLVGYSPWGHKESDMTGHAHMPNP